MTDSSFKLPVKPTPTVEGIVGVGAAIGGFLVDHFFFPGGVSSAVVALIAGGGAWMVPASLTAFVYSERSTQLRSLERLLQRLDEPELRVKKDSKDLTRLLRRRHQQLKKRTIEPRVVAKTLDEAEEALDVVEGLTARLGAMKEALQNKIELKKRDAGIMINDKAEKGLDSSFEDQIKDFSASVELYEKSFNEGKIGYDELLRALDERQALILKRVEVLPSLRRAEGLSAMLMDMDATEARVQKAYPRGFEETPAGRPWKDIRKDLARLNALLNRYLRIVLGNSSWEDSITRSVEEVEDELEKLYAEASGLVSFASASSSKLRDS